MAKRWLIGAKSLLVSNSTASTGNIREADRQEFLDT